VLGKSCEHPLSGATRFAWHLKPIGGAVSRTRLLARYSPRLSSAPVERLAAMVGEREHDDDLVDQRIRH